MSMRNGFLTVIFLVVLACMLNPTAARAVPPGGDNVSPEIRAIFDRPLYKGARWGLRVIREGHVVVDVDSKHPFLIGSVRKVFSIGQLLNQVGPLHTYDTPVYGLGTIDRRGVLRGNLVLVASGDLTMGGRTLPNGRIAISGYDHNEADSLGNAVLTPPDPLAGYRALARQVAASGLKEIKGEVIVDDRLFKPFNFRGEFDVRPIFVNDDVIDLTITPAAVGAAASVVSRPRSAALRIDSALRTGPAGSPSTLKIDPELPPCIGTPGCTTRVLGSLPSGFVPTLTNKLPLVQTVRIVQPANYARTVFIEALQAQGIKVDAARVEANPARLLPSRSAYSSTRRLALLKGMPYGEYARLILKVSYNIGADTSLVLFGLTHGVASMPDALIVERDNLAKNYGIPSASYKFIDGSGGGDTTATNLAVTQMLGAMMKSRYFSLFEGALPSLGIDGSLNFVTDFKKNPTLAGAAGQVHAKTGTYVAGSSAGTVLKGQALAGYIHSRSGKNLIFEVVVNDVPISGLPDVLQVFQDQGTISAILWRDN